ncbi:MAG: hypothetical protein SPI77_03815 [Corynebacterium sp.]|nr:hypothetical protein [Corynebacterium sp.]
MADDPDGGLLHGLGLLSVLVLRARVAGRRTVPLADAAGRKLGHVNLCGADAAATRRDAELAAGFLVNAAWADQNLTGQN